MRKVLFGLLITMLIFTTSCKKNNNNISAIGPGGSWSFLGINSPISSGSFNVITGSNLSAILAVDSAVPSGDFLPNIEILFPDSVFPTTSCTYNVVPYYGNPPMAGQVAALNFNIIQTQ